MAGVSTEPRPSPLKVAASVSFYMVAAIAMILANKWVLNETDAPVFFLFCQLVVAVLLFVIAHVVGILKLPRMVDGPLLKGLMPMIAVNVLGLNFNNWCLKYVDASFYQIARGLVLPFTVITSIMFLRAAPPSKRILLACSIVTGGFFTGVFLDHVTASGLASSKDAASQPQGPSALGVFFGILSSMSTALQAVVIKRALDVVDGSAIDLAWYTNLLSAIGTIPVILLAGELPSVLSLLFGTTNSAALGTFLWGTAVTSVYLMTFDTPIYSVGGTVRTAHKRPNRSRPSPCSSPISSPMQVSPYPPIFPKRSPSVGLRQRRRDSTDIPSVDVAVQAGNGNLENLFEDDLSTPELLEPPSLPPAKIDWEIPRKALHSSIGFLVLPLYFSRPEVAPIIEALTYGLAFVTAADVLRLNIPPLLASTKNSSKAINGVIWYLVGVIFVLKFYPRDVAVVSILILSWCDTAASTVGRAWGRYTPKLPRSILYIPIAPRKSLAGALGAIVTGSLIAFSFWGWAVTPEYIPNETPAWHWAQGGWLGLGALSLCSGLAAGITEALDIGGLDDNLTLPIISGGLVWGIARLITALL
ncbi:Triose-phosphate Transporter family [Rhizoctonia solani]|uniref:Triose-phosphate Transporter family n=1 Tax=Rhizoctonia solani TaxID=456999 RepID=A0A8H8P733_9AGAM|nr:Triose-phosphate Transporter family [Rhizoctonia solani]QRW25770.1 Triose-phosphate Transporter family [Rhizoctonia solani]